MGLYEPLPVLRAVVKEDEAPGDTVMEMSTHRSLNQRIGRYVPCTTAQVCSSTTANWLPAWSVMPVSKFQAGWFAVELILAWIPAVISDPREPPASRLT
jgi:hypothetical protein